MQDLEFAAVLKCKDQSPLEMHLFQFAGSWSVPDYKDAPQYA